MAGSGVISEVIERAVKETVSSQKAPKVISNKAVNQIKAPVDKGMREAQEYLSRKAAGVTKGMSEASTGAVVASVSGISAVATAAASDTAEQASKFGARVAPHGRGTYRPMSGGGSTALALAPQYNGPNWNFHEPSISPDDIITGGGAARRSSGIGSRVKDGVSGKYRQMRDDFSSMSRGQKAKAIGMGVGAYAAVNLSGRAARGGSATRNPDGEKDIAGIPIF